MASRTLFWSILKHGHSFLFFFREPLDRAESISTQLLCVLCDSWGVVAHLHPSDWKHWFSHLEFSTAVKVCILWFPCQPSRISFVAKDMLRARNITGTTILSRLENASLIKQLFNPSVYKFTSRSDLKVLL